MNGFLGEKWDYINDPAMLVSVFESDEKSAMMVVECGPTSKPANVQQLLNMIATCNSSVDSEAAKLTDSEMGKYLCAEERRDLLRCIATGTFVGDEDEQTIMRLLKTAPLNQKEKLLQLITGTADLLDNLHSSIDGEELKDYYIQLINLYRLSKPESYWADVQRKFDALESSGQKRTLEEWSKEKVFFWLDVGFIDYITEGRIVYENTAITTDNRVTFDQYTNVGLVPTAKLNEVKDVNLKAFDDVRVYFLSESEQLAIPKGEHVDLPAIALGFLIQQQFNREAWLTVNSAFIIGTLGSGSFATLWGKFDVFLGLGAILEDNYRADLAKTEEGRAVLTAWKVLNVALLARLGYKVAVGIPEAWKSLANAIARLRVKSPGLAQQLETEAKQVFGEYVSVADDVAVGAGKTLASSGDELLSLGRNIVKGSDEMLSAAKNRITKYRADMKGVKKLGGNLGYVEGEINGVKLSDEIVSSSAPKASAPEIFEAKYVNSQNQIKPGEIDGAYLRTGDSEFQMLSNVAQQLGLQKGQVYNYTGTVKIVSELPYCGSCSGVIHQFSEMLPNVKIIIVNGIK